MPALTVEQIAQICDGITEGDATRVINGANDLESANEKELSFVNDVKKQTAAVVSRAGCLIVTSAFDAVGPWSLIRVKQPRAAFANALRALYPRKRPSGEIHPTAIISPTAVVASDASVGAYTTIGDATRVERGCQIANGVHIGDRVVIGEHTIIHPNVTVYDEVQIGHRVILHAGCVIGSDGFGFVLEGARYEKFPQVGVAVLEDDVEIGANSCVDRAALGETRIGAGTKLDNLVHVAHNCTVGKHVVIAAQTGFAGGVTVGDYAAFGGQVGVAEKAKIASRAIIGAKSGIVNFQKIDAGEPVWGIPARPIREHLKGLANVGKISELRNDVRNLKSKLNEILKDEPEASD